MISRIYKGHGTRVRRQGIYIQNVGGEVSWGEI
jgi:hypothetical protein